MLKFQVTTPDALTDQVLAALSEDPAVSSLAVVRGASLRPRGDLVLADVAREAANDPAAGSATSGFTRRAACTSNR